MVEHVVYDIYIGLCLAVFSSLFIGASFVIKKKGLLRLTINGRTRASSGGYGYLKEWIWWAGLLSMGIGEAANFIAYAFAPASLVTPLGALSVLVSAIFSSKYLGERLNLLGKVGCFLCIIGSTDIVLHSPKEGTVDSMERLQELLFQPGFVTYVSAIIFMSSVLVVYCVPRYGTTNVVIYVLICSMIGSLSVMECKGLGLALRETISGTQNELTNWVTWLCLICLILCVSVQINYLNKALDTFNTSVVTPVYYVIFTTFVIFASAILFQEWSVLSSKDIIGSVCAFLTVISGIFLLNVFREWDITLNNVSFQKKEPSIDIIEQCHSHVNNETSNLLERHSRNNSMESRFLSSINME
ncbi:magnesium transporter NIPA2 isoform X2 [Parasteatoda tepidariorum]|nr:magnesium transporter NIPA2 isoform X2 [Parasteatoda tepidariorum]XP_015920548.1 magnesium transporter NIPA2 isoform X2 [Parasteatoda tepidariorum]